MAGPRTSWRSPDGFVFSADGMELTLNPVGERAVSLGDQGLTVERLGDDIRITRTLREGESGGVVLDPMGGQPRRIPPAELEQLSEDTAAFWRGWAGHSTYRGRWREMVARSAMTLKLMTYAPSGALVAAPTAGLPELTGGSGTGTTASPGCGMPHSRCMRCWGWAMWKKPPGSGAGCGTASRKARTKAPIR
jgi:hypothetical protein